MVSHNMCQMTINGTERHYELWLEFHDKGCHLCITPPNKPLHSVPMHGQRAHIYATGCKRRISVRKLYLQLARLEIITAAYQTIKINAMLTKIQQCNHSVYVGSENNLSLTLKAGCTSSPCGHDWNLLSITYEVKYKRVKDIGDRLVLYPHFIILLSWWAYSPVTQFKLNRYHGKSWQKLLGLNYSGQTKTQLPLIYLIADLGQSVVQFLGGGIALFTVTINLVYCMYRRNMALKP